MVDLTKYTGICTRSKFSPKQHKQLVETLRSHPAETTRLDVLTLENANTGGVVLHLKEGKYQDWAYNPSHGCSYLEVDVKDLIHFAVTGYIPSEVPPKKPDPLGAKYDGGKLLFRALTRGLALPLRAVAAVLTYGALKYKEDSWQHVPNGKARYESALDRHLNAWKAGEKCDEESGLPHIAHAACNALFLLWFDITDGSIEGDYTKFNTPPSQTS